MYLYMLQLDSRHVLLFVVCLINSVTHVNYEKLTSCNSCLFTKYKINKENYLHTSYIHGITALPFA